MCNNDSECPWIYLLSWQIIMTCETQFSPLYLFISPSVQKVWISEKLGLGKSDRNIWWSEPSSCLWLRVPPPRPPPPTTTALFVPSWAIASGCTLRKIWAPSICHFHINLDGSGQEDHNHLSSWSTFMQRSHWSNWKKLNDGNRGRV